jgi:3-methylfumaryl-CoA hydratase
MTTPEVAAPEDWSPWIGRVDVRTDVLRAHLGAELLGVLGLPDDADQSGRGPGGIHWLLFDRFLPADELSEDGHPRRGGFLPPVDLPRRMWAGGELEFLAPIPLEQQLTRRSTIRTVSRKDGSRGPLVFVTVDHAVEDASGAILIKERQDIVYTVFETGAKAPQAAVSEPLTPGERSFAVPEPNSVSLFRYSALTHNGHRIHYDADYARDVEGYPGLVVHGPLTATLLIWFARTVGDTDGLGLKTFSFRGRSPLFLGTPVQLVATWADNELLLEARADGRSITMTATATF